MTMDRSPRADRVVIGLFDELADARTPDYLEAAIERASSRPQRPAWTFLERWFPMAETVSLPATASRVPWRSIGVALVIIALLVAAAFAYIGTHQTRVPAPFGPAANGLIPFVSNGDLYLGDPATGKTRAVLAGTDEDFSPGYSPDGTRLAFIRATGPEWADGTPAPVDLYTMRDDGSNVVKITPTPIDALLWATWTPDSRKLAITYGDGAWSRMMILDADGRQAPLKVTTPTNPDNLAFRPTDGQELLFRGKFLYPDDRFGLYVMNADGTNIRTLVEPATDNGEDLNNAIYSPDGSRIFYQRWFPDSIQLWVMDADGGNRHEFRPEPGPGWDGVPNPSPDGRWITWWHNIQDGRATQRVAVARADGTGDVILTGPELRGRAHWIWSPDSTRILMYDEESKARQAYLLDPLGGPAATVPWLSDGDLDWQRKAP